MTERNVQHARTELAGIASHRAARFSAYDDEGPWSYVTFFDGFSCWVPDAVLIERV